MKYVVSHLSPDTDAISSIWLVRRFMHGWKNARLKFVPAGSTYQEMSVDSNPDILHVDTGLGKFDHHQHNDDTCAAKIISEYLGDRGYIKGKIREGVIRMTEVINETDHFRDVFFPEADHDRYAFMLDSIFDGLHGRLSSDNAVVEEGEVILDGILQSMINKITAEEDIRSGFIFKSQWGESLSVESENEETMRLAQKKGFMLTVRKSKKKGFLRVKLSPAVSGKIPNLRALYELLRKKDPKATWFFHASGHMILNGSSKNPVATPTHLTLTQVIEMIKKLK